MDTCWCGNFCLEDYGTNYWKCPCCKTLISKKQFDEQTYEIKEENIDLYGSNYWKDKMLSMTKKENLQEIVNLYLQERALYWLNYLTQYVLPPEKVLEVGCGLGQFSYLLKCLGYNQVAYELSPEICDWVRTELNIHIVCGDAKLSLGKFKAIVAFDLLEHLIDPKEFLLKMNEKLEENGVLILQTPKYDPNLTYEQMKKTKLRFTEQLKDQEHIFIYSEQSITTILKSVGFQYITFEPAFFGDDYDMFIFASKEAIIKNEKKEINDVFHSVSNGYLIEAMLSLFEKKQELEKENTELEMQGNARLQDVILLNNELKNLTDKEATLYQEREIQLKNLDTLTSEINRLQDENRMFQEECEKRLKDVLTLTEMIKEMQKNKE